MWSRIRRFSPTEMGKTKPEEEDRGSQFLSLTHSHRLPQVRILVTRIQSSSDWLNLVVLHRQISYWGNNKLEPPALLQRISSPTMKRRRTGCSKELNSPWIASISEILPDSKQLLASLMNSTNGVECQTENGKKPFNLTSLKSMQTLQLRLRSASPLRSLSLLDQLSHQKVPSKRPRPEVEDLLERISWGEPDDNNDEERCLIKRRAQ